MRAIPAAFLVLLGAQAAGPERLVYADRSEIRGTFQGVDPAGGLLFKDDASGRVLNVSPEESWRLAFEGDAAPADPKGPEESVRFAFGGGLSGRRILFEKDEAVVEHEAGRFRVRRSEIRQITLAAPSGPMPEIKEGTEDVVVREDDKKVLVAELGRVTALGDVLRLAGPAGERTFPRASVKLLQFRDGARAVDTPSGWFVKVALRNGDKFVGVLRGADPGRVTVFSTALGSASLERRHLRSLTFVPTARLSAGHLLLCDQAGVREVDRTGREIWSYQQSAQYAWSARKLENGNVLIANTNFNQVLEVKPNGRTGGEIVWRLDQANYPYDAVRLDSGNTLVAEYAMNRVAEYDGRTKALAWEFAIEYPQSVQRLENGNTLVCTNATVVEIDRQKNVKWRLEAEGVRPHRATRLENGNTLIVDHQRHRVVELSPQGVEVWKAQNLSRPVQAIRLDDGGTLVLEQGGNRIVEIDAAGTGKRVLSEIRDLRYPQGMSMY